jgi:DNA-binding response OmpR family regulator
MNTSSPFDPARGDSGFAGAPASTILIVEDDAVLRDTIVELFSEAGWATTWARDGADGLATFRADPADVILTDIMMPSMSGLELVKRVREFDFDTPILILTGYASFDNSVLALRAGADDFLDKPFENEELLAAAHRLLGNPLAPSAADGLAPFARHSAELTFAPGDLLPGNARAAEIRAYVDAWVTAAGFRRRRLAIIRAVSIVLDQIFGRLVLDTGSGGGKEPALEIAMKIDSRRCVVEFRSRRALLDWVVSPTAVPTGKPDPAHDERSPFLLHSFCDEVHRDESGDRLSLVFFRPRTDRPLRRGA